MRVKRCLVLMVLLVCTLSVWGAKVSLETARQQAGEWFAAHTPKGFRYNGIKEVIPMKGDGQTLFYIINLKGDGWILVSADDRTDRVLGYSYQGTFDHRRGNSAIKTVLENHRDTINAVIRGEIEVPRQTISPRSFARAELTQTVEPLITSQWTQTSPYNKDCPLENGLATFVGCGALSSSQIMHYWQYPEHGTGVYNGINFQNTYYAWSAMPNKLTTTSTTTEINAVAQLVHHVGVSLDMRYHSASASLSADSDIDDMFRDFFDYAATFDYGISIGYSNLPGVVKTDIDKGWPVQFNGYSATFGGHAFVCDGYEVRADATYLHFNFGWGGMDNGYYKLFSVNCPATGYDFNKKYTIVHNIRPNKPLIATCNPNSGNLTVDQLATQIFSIRASQINGTALTYSWKVDNTTMATTTSSFSYSFLELRNYTVTGTVTDGTNNKTFTWNVQVGAGTPDELKAPLNLTVSTTSATINLTWTAPTGVSSLNQYLVYRNNTQIGTTTATQTSYSDTNFIYGTNYTYYVSAHYTNPEGESPASNSVTANVPVPPTSFSENFESGSFGTGWSFAGQAWYVTTGAGEGTYCARNPALSSDGAADISFSYTFSGAGTISFQKYVYTSLYSSDYFKFYIDGQLQATYKEQTGWQTVSFNVSPGQHTFLWRYEKTGFISSKFFVKLDDIKAKLN